MRILLADSGREMRGGQWQALYLIRGLRDRGLAPQLLARAGGALYHRARSEGFQTAGLSPAALFSHSRRADLVHTQDGRSHALAAVFSSKPVVVARRVAFAPGTGFASRWKLRQAAKYIAVSRFVASVLEHAGVPPDRIAVVYDGVALPPQVPAFESRSIAVLAIPTGDRMKGDDLLREAATIAGVDVHWSERLMEDLPNARVFAYVSRSEGLGSAALLALACGTPVAASRAGGLEEAVAHERTGLLFENRPADIASALVRLSRDPDLAARLGAQGRADVSERFSLHRMVDATIAVYRSVLG